MFIYTSKYRDEFHEIEINVIMISIRLYDEEFVIRIYDCVASIEC